jgi:16S rRNA (guanine527-N7)-methyltransferase
VPADLKARLHERAAGEGIVVSDALASRLVVYFELLRRWNRTINLTSLTDSNESIDDAIDRLLLEPLAAAAALPHRAALADLGSGGGSPAIPLALATESSRLLMVESRSRKVAFLREAAREVGLSAAVEPVRFEELASQATHRGCFDIVTIRAVRRDTAALTAAAGLLRPNGLVALFRGPDGAEEPESLIGNLAWRETQPLLRSTRSRLSVLFHVEH